MREITIRDSLSGERATLQPGEVGIYACGPTVYSRVHVGNARPFVVFMLLRRFLEREGHSPRLVINVTDVNDKIYAAARDAGRPSAEYAAEMTRLYVEDTDRLGLGRPDFEPRATETMDEIVELIATLIERGHAYESGGDVYFHVRGFPGYGRLSNRDPDEMDQGEEAGSAELKRDPLDFALWKARKPEDDTSWPAPWGEGRPGWHIECSAMAEKLLGLDFAIHGGGADLVFPHHENEIAQTEAARGRPLARIWMHNGMVRIAEEKMSKSVGNSFQLGEALDRHGREALIAYLVSGHYRQPLEFSDEALQAAAARVERIRNFARAPRADGEATDWDPVARQALEAFLAALADDFNTPRALGALFELIAEANRRRLPGAGRALAEMLPLLGLESLLAADEAPDADADALRAQRDAARAERDFQRADRIRAELEALGWEVRDEAGGSRLVRRP